MSDDLKNYLAQDVASLEESNKDFTPHVQKSLAGIFSQCAQDTEYPHGENNTDHENFGWFANCVRNNVFVNPVLN